MLRAERPPQWPGVSSHISFSSPRLSANEIAGGGFTSPAWNSRHVPLAKVIDHVFICLPTDVLDASVTDGAGVWSGWWGRLMVQEGMGVWWVVMQDVWGEVPESSRDKASPFSIIERLVASWLTWASEREIDDGCEEPSASERWQHVSFRNDSGATITTNLFCNSQPSPSSLQSVLLAHVWMLDRRCFSLCENPPASISIPLREKKGIVLEKEHLPMIGYSQTHLALSSWLAPGDVREGEPVHHY